MSDKTDDPGSSENPATPPTEPTTPTAPAAPTQQPPAAQQPNVPATPRRSLWGEAVSTTGGKVAVIVAGASLGLIALICGGLVIGAVAHHLGDDRGPGPWASDSRGGPMPDRMGPGEQGPEGMAPDRVPPQQRGGPGDLPELGLPGAGGPLHGEAVVPGDGTGTTTILFQRGQVTDVTADKLTVKSTDGFSATYTIGAESRDRLKKKVSTLAKGDEVTVIASKDGNETLRILKTGRTGPTS